MVGQFCGRCAEPVGSRDRYCERCGAWVVDPRRDRIELDAGVAAETLVAAPRAEDGPVAAARHLVEIALHRGGKDNVTVAVLPFPG